VHRRRACFFAKVRSRQELDTIEFYAQDRQLLSELGFDVQVAIHPWELKPADLYLAWWWTWAFIPVAFAKGIRRPIVITGTFNYWSFDNRPRWQRCLIDYSVNNANCNIAVSELERKELSRFYPFATWTYSPHVVDADIYREGCSERKEIVYTTATMVPGNAERKCIPELIKAATIVHQACRDVQFVLAGECHPRYVELANTLGAASYISFPGVVSRGDKIRYLQECKVYAQPSRFEGFGLGILEAMSCGAPVLTSPVGAVQEVVGSASAELVDGTSPEGIAMGLIRLLRDDGLRATLGQSGCARAKALFSMERRKRDLARVIATVC
jgi:glycosyltransferase involved in cell wall biosynthesis